MITRGPSLTEQVRQHLKQRIVEDGFEEGRIPPETELAAELGVSRTTVRDALSRLAHEGAIVRRQGAGTFVNPAGLRIKTRLEEMWSYEDMLRDHGFTPSVEVLAIETGPARQDTAEALQLADDGTVLTMTKVFYEDDDPVVLTTNHVPAGLLPDEIDEQDAAGPIFELFEREANAQLSYYVSEVVPIVLDGVQATSLDVTAGTPAISLDETGFTGEGTPLVHAQSILRDDLLRLRVMRRQAGT